MSQLEKQFFKAYEDYSAPIFRHCFFRVFSRARAEDLVQETFLRLWAYLRDGKTVENIRAFLYKIANNLIIDDSRKKKESSLDEILEDPERPEPASEDHRHIETSILLNEVMVEIKTLPTEDRELLVMRYVDDLDPKDIAEVLGITANNVSVKLNRALKNLKEKIH